MKYLILAIYAVVAYANTITLTFRGLDIEYLMRPFALSTLREVIACHGNIPFDDVQIASITYLNETVIPEASTPVYPIKCAVSNSVRWSSQWMPGTAELIKELRVEEPVHVQLKLPATIKVEGVNIVEFIITCINEKYANVLVYDYTYFYKDSLKILSKHAIIPFNGLLGESEYQILAFMFIIQIILIVCGNMVLRRLRLQPSAAAAYDKIYVTVK